MAALDERDREPGAELGERLTGVARVAREAEDAQIINVVEGMDEPTLNTTLRYKTMSGEAQATPMRLVLGHLFNHQTHHRGQAHGLLSQTAVPPPPLDLIYFLREAD